MDRMNLIVSVARDIFNARMAIVWPEAEYVITLFIVWMAVTKAMIYATNGNVILMRFPAVSMDHACRPFCNVMVFNIVPIKQMKLIARTRVKMMNFIVRGNGNAYQRYGCAMEKSIARVRFNFVHFFF